GQALGLVELAASQCQLRLQGVGGEQVGIQPGAAGQRLAGLVDLPVAQQGPGALQVQVGVLRVQRDGLVDGLERSGDLAGEPQCRGQVPMCLGVLRLLLHGFAGGGECFVCSATAQGGGDVVVHADPGNAGKPSIVAAAPDGS